MRKKWEERAAKLAVTRFGLDPERVQQAYRETTEARKEGIKVDLVEVLLRAKLLNRPQSIQLRELAEKTQLDADVTSPAADAAKKSTPAREATRPATTAPAADSAGPGVIGEYRILRKIGEGGMGEVFLAYDESADREVAIKVLARYLAEKPDLVERFRREARHAIHLDHPNIVRGYSVDQDKATGKHYIVMEYVDGPSAQALLDEYGRLSIGDAAHLALDLARALEYAHSRNVIHRDIKPENILCTRSGIVKLADLGLAKQLGQSSNLTATRQGFGTPYYMPYEQAMSAKAADARSDIYALGATLYHLVTGQVPFQAESQVEILELKEKGVYYPASSVRPGVPDALNHILDRMMARHPGDRYQTASDLIVDLERSKLANAVLSFADQGAARQDPHFQARVQVATQATQIDIHAPRREPSPKPKTWHLRYHDENTGKLCELTATTDQVLRRIRQGKLNGTVQAGTAAAGPFRWLSDWPEFSDAMREMGFSKSKPRVQSPATPKSVPAWLLIVGCAVCFLLAVIAFYLLLR
jgi:eukaryotic-like serine/threonine-protein kinase